MISFNENQIVEIELSKAEQKAILTHLKYLDDTLLRKISISMDTKIFLLREDAVLLSKAVAVALEEIPDPAFKSLFNKLMQVIFEKYRTNPELDQLADEYFDEIDEEEEDEDEDEDDNWSNLSDEFNQMPDREMGGLTPEQVWRLIYTDWNDKECPIIFNKTLPFHVVNKITIFRNARLFLQTLIQWKKETTVTAKGNLCRKFVKVMFDQMEIEKRRGEVILTYNKVINEADVFELHILKIVCESAGLIKKRKKHFIVPKRIASLLSQEKAGQLYYTLFYSYFRKFNLAYADGCVSADSAQATFSYILYRISKVCEKGMYPYELYRLIFLPAVREEIAETSMSVRDIALFVQIRILRHLEQFGLLNSAVIKEKYLDRMGEVKTTPLFDQFITFDL